MFFSKTIQDIILESKINITETELLIAHVINKPREFVIAHPEVKVPSYNVYKVITLLKQRKQGVPLAYLTGHKEFFGLDFVVNKHVLVPRPETEILVTTALQHYNTKPLKNTMLIDVGTGSGCITVSVTSALKHLSTQALTVYATDISKSALKVAKKNAKKHNVEITFLHGNLLKPFTTHSPFLIPHSSLIITANLPYLTQEQFQNEHSIQYEPKSALVANNNGLGLYEELLKQIRLLITNYQLQITCFFEIDPSQTKQITRLIQTYIPNATIEIQKDLARHDRVVIIQME